MITEPTTTGSPATKPTGDDDEASTFFIALGAVLLGTVSLLIWFVLKAADYFGDGDVPAFIGYRWWFLVAAVGLIVLGAGLQINRLSTFVTQRRSLFALNAILMTALAAMLVVLSNYVGNRHYKEFDWTKTGVYSISDESVQVAMHLEKPIRLWVIWPGNDESLETLNRLIDHYRSKSDKIEVLRADPTTDLTNYERITKLLGIDDRSFDDQAGVVVQSGYYDDKKEWKAEKSKHISHREIFEQSFDPMSGGRGAKKFKGEQVLTNAIIEVTEQAKPKLYFMTGHHELDLEGQNSNNPDEMGFLSKLLRQKNYDVESLDILKREHKDIPEDCNVLVIAFPRDKFDDQEVAALELYLKNGGKLMALMGANLVANATNDKLVWKPVGIEPLLKKYNVECEDRTVMGFERQGQFLMPVNKCYVTWFDSDHKITQPLASSGARAIMFGARTLKVTTENPHAKTTELAKSNEREFAVADPMEFESNPNLDAEHKAWTVMVAVEEKIDAPAPPPDPKDKDKKKPADKTTKIIVAGDARWISNPIVDVGGYRNEPLFFNCLSYLLGQERFTKEPAKESTYKLDMSPGLTLVYSAVSVLGMPLFAMILGLSIWLIRRR